MIYMWTKDGVGYTLTDEGAVTARTDGPKGWDYSGHWIILGFLRRSNARHIVTLEAALNGADVGRGYVVDLDGDTLRVWTSPTGARLARLARS